MSDSYYSINDAPYPPKVSGEARKFIDALPPNFVSAQIEALNEAIAGDSSKLNAIRRARLVPIEDRPDVFFMRVEIDFGGEKRHLYIYAPRRVEGRAKVVIYYHGGGWCINSPEGCSRACQDIASRTGAIVVAPQYRLSPEFPYPAANLDALKTFEWVRENIEKFGGDAGKIFLAGDSAGGHLAASSALRLKGQVAGVAMFYPVADLSAENSRGSRREFASGYCLDGELMKLYTKAYLKDFGLAKNPAASPIFGDFEGCANSLIVASQCDVLRDEARDLALKIRGAGASVRYVCIGGATHIFITQKGMDGAYKRALDEAVMFILKN